MLTGLFGQGIGQALGSYSHLGNLGAAAQQAQLGQGYPTQQHLAQAQQMSYAHGIQTHRPMEWMFNGRMVSFKEFVELVFPEDTAEKTAFILKYAKE